MSKTEEHLFKKYEKETNHQALLRLTERIAKSGWILMVIAIGAFVYFGQVPTSYAFLLAALSLLAASLYMGFRAEKTRKEIQDRVDRELGQ